MPAPSARERHGRLVTEFEAGKPVLYCVPACDDCGFETKIRVKSKRHAPPDLIAQVLRNRGWSVSPGRQRCPNCAVKRITAPIKPKEAAVAEVAPPRTMTIDDRRKVREALYERYDEEKQSYRQSWSDRAVGAALGVPWAWVTDMRESLGFGPDRNEASEIRDRRIREIETEMAQISDDFMARMSALETLVKQLKVDGAYKAA
jgi:hypothetical protein